MAIRILFAEDEDSLREIVVDNLKQEGYELEAVDDGAEAIELLQKKSYDIVLLDIRMPKKTGLDVLEFMRDKKIRTRAIMATGVDDMAVAIQSLKLGASDFVTKPYSIAAIVDSITKVLEK
jgi:DNA-binding response OmpR family regulator